MKKTSAVISVIAVLALAAGCKKENGLIELPVTIENYASGSKVYIDAINFSCWNDGDKVQVNGEEATVHTSIQTSATITVETGVTSPYYAIFPASCVTGYSAGNYSVALPATQLYREDGSGNQLIDGVMAAYGTDGLSFKNLTALVKVTFTNSTQSSLTVGTITLSTTAAGQHLSGVGTVAITSSGSHSLTMTGGKNTVSLRRIGEDVGAGASFTCYVVVPAISNIPLKVEVLTDKGVYSMSTTRGATLRANDVGPLPMNTACALDPTRGCTSGHEWVKLSANGPKWAVCNVGAVEETDCGDYFAWGETETYYEGVVTDSPSSWKPGKDQGYISDSYRFYDISSYLDPFTRYNDGDDKTVLELSDDAARVNWNRNWRIPTADEWQELIDTCTWSPATVNGVAGYSVTSQVYNNNSIFIPAVGWFEGTRRNYASSSVESSFRYWSATLNEDDKWTARCLTDNSNGVLMDAYERRMGLPIRPVFD